MIATSLIASLALAGAPLASDKDADSARKTMQRYAECLVNTERYKLRPALEKPVGTEGTKFLWAKLSTDSCLSKVGDFSSSDGLTLSFEAALLRGAVFEALLRNDFDEVPKATSFNEVGALAYPIAATAGSPGDPEAAAYAVEMEIGDCAVRKDPAPAYAILETPIASDDELNAMKAMVPALSACTLKGQTLNFSRSVVRGMVAEVLYRLTAAAQGLKHAHS